MEQRITATSNQNLLDLAVKEMKGLSGIFEAAFTNGLSITDDLEGLTLTVEIDEAKKAEVAKVVSTIVAEPQYLKAVESQNFLDIALQTAGAVSAMFDLAQQNSMSVTDNIVGADILKINAVDADILQYYNKHNIRPATGGQINKENIPETPQGVDYWAIEIDFLVS